MSDRYRPRINKVIAVAIHVLTASGALLGLLAIKAASEQKFELVFLWLGIALLVDAVDGPLARKVSISETLPKFSGERLDIIVDYVNYVAVPAYLILTASIVPKHLEIFAAALVTLSALYHFADTKSKTSDGYFVGFPATWNIIVFYVFAFELSPLLAFLTIVLFSFLTFVPMKWMHLVRVVRMRYFTLSLLTVTALAILQTLYNGFPADSWAKIVLLFCGFYVFVFSLIRSFFRSED